MGFRFPRSTPKSVPSWWRPPGLSRVPGLDRLEHDAGGRAIERTKQTEAVETRDRSAQRPAPRTGQESSCAGAHTEVHLPDARAGRVPMVHSPGEPSVQAFHLDRVRRIGEDAPGGHGATELESRNAALRSPRPWPARVSSRDQSTRFAAHRATRPHDDRRLRGIHAERHVRACGARPAWRFTGSPPRTGTRSSGSSSARRGQYSFLYH